MISWTAPLCHRCAEKHSVFEFCSCLPSLLPRFGGVGARRAVEVGSVTAYDNSPFTLRSPPNRLQQLDIPAKRTNTKTIWARGDKVTLFNYKHFETWMP